MKKIIVFMAIAIQFALLHAASAQSVDSLRRYCIVFPDAEFILSTAVSSHIQNMNMSEYGKNNAASGNSFPFEMIAVYQWDRSSIALNCLANDIWSLVAKQLHGEVGALTLNKGNFIPTKSTNNTPMLAIIVWNQKVVKWEIMSIPLSKVKMPIKGTRIFLPKS